MASRRLLRGLCATSIVALSACAAASPTPGPGGGDAEVAGSYVGSLTIDGRPFGVTLTLRGSGSPRLRGVLRIPEPLEVEGEAEGVVMDDLLRLTVHYRDADGCDGRIEGILDVTRGGARIEGPVTVTDCQSPVSGRLTLSRRAG